MRIASTSPKPPISNYNLIQEIAYRADKNIAGSGALVGLQKHQYAAQFLKRYQRLYGQRGLLTEYSPNRNIMTKGYSIFDVYDASRNIIYDYKFGGARMSNAQANKYFNAVPNPSIFVVRPYAPMQKIR